MKPRPYIRLAVPGDLPEIMELLTRFHAECGLAPLNVGKVEANVLSIAALADLFIVEVEGKIVAALGLTENVLWYSDGRILGAHFFYVAPEHRGGLAGQMLLQAGALEAERRKLPFLLSVQDPRRAKRRGRIAEIEGYFPAGFTLLVRDNRSE